MRVLDLFSGIGGFSLGLERAGMKTVAFCEIDPYCRQVLRKHWPNVPIFEDVRNLSSQHITAAGIGVDAICGGFPCQDISRAGYMGGITGERSGLWREYARLIGEIRPRYVLVENVAALLERGMDTVCGDLAAIGYDAEWSVISACSVGAPHLRQRVFIVAYPNTVNGGQRIRNNWKRREDALQEIDSYENARANWKTRMDDPSSLYGNANGVPFRVDRGIALGNSIVPQVSQIVGRAIMLQE